jgi:hypothetical protein
MNEEERNGSSATAGPKDCQVPPEDVFEWIFEGLFIFIAGNIGILGNCISIRTFSRQKVHRIFHNLLLTLAIFDLVKLTKNHSSEILAWTFSLNISIQAFQFKHLIKKDSDETFQIRHFR